MQFVKVILKPSFQLAMGHSISLILDRNCDVCRRSRFSSVPVAHVISQLQSPDSVPMINSSDNASVPEDSNITVLIQVGATPAPTLSPILSGSQEPVMVLA